LSATTSTVRALILPWLLVATLLSAAAPAAASSPSTIFRIEKQYRQAKAYYQNLITTSRGNTRSNWLYGAGLFRKLYQAYPDQPVAAKSLFMLGKIYLAMHERFHNPLDLGEAVAYFEDVRVLFPKHSLADDALFQVGIIYLDKKKDPAKAATTFAKVVALYPDGDMTTGAAEKLHELKGIDFLNTLNRSVRKTSPSPGSARLHRARLLPVRYWSNDNYTRVVIQTSLPVRFRKQELKSNGDRPRRIAIDLIDCQIPPDLPYSVPVEDGLLQRVRNAQFTPSIVRVVLDTQNDIAEFKVFSLDEPFRVVVDLKSAGPFPPRNVVKDAPTSLARQLGLGIRRIVIDPGHGGKDPGTVGPNGLKEKDIVLKVAKFLARELRKRLPSCEVILTRDRDVFIPLEERTAIANSKNGDLFLSIHVNAAPTKAARGIETYILDLATSEDAMRVAAQENAVSAKNISDLQAILMDLMQNTKVNESVKLAEKVQEAMINGLKKRYPVHDLGVKRAPFIVLVGAQMPAILTEIGFLSHPEESKRLASDRYLEQVAVHLAGGVSRYAAGLSLASIP